MTGIKILLLTGVVMGSTAAGSLIEDHSVDIKTVAAVGTIVLGGTWSLSRRFTRLDDRISAVESALKVMPCTKVPAVALATIKCHVENQEIK